MPVVIDDLRKFNRSELIDIIADYQRNEKKLNDRIEELEKELSSRLIIKEESGSIAEAALAINKVFEASQAAADQYYESAKSAMDLRIQRVEQEAQAEIDEKIKDAVKQAQEIIEAAREKAKIEEQEIDRKIEIICQLNPGLEIKRST